ncbi:MAG: hypothetical protein J0H19_24030 [Rhodospirillales bacterium]|nr:hypothetical protein [Rhodospirillales bacterium]
MTLTVEFKKASETDGLMPFQANLVLLKADRTLIQGQWNGLEFVDFETGDPVFGVEEFAVLEHPLMPSTPTLRN